MGKTETVRRAGELACTACIWRRFWHAAGWPGDAAALLAPVAGCSGLQDGSGDSEAALPGQQWRGARLSDCCAVDTRQHKPMHLLQC